MRRRAFALLSAALVGAAAALVIATPASAVTGRVVVSATASGTGFVGAAANCPAGTKVLGGGGDVTTFGAFKIQSSIPQTAPQGWYAYAEPIGAYTGIFTVKTWAVCASGVTGQEIVVSEQRSTLGSPFVTTRVTCPAGKKVIGAGGLATKWYFTLDTISVASDLSTVTTEAYAPEGDVTYREGSITLAAYAICIDPVAGQQLVTTSTDPSTVDKLATAACPAGTHLHSVGGGLTGAAGGAYLNAIIPSADLVIVDGHAIAGAPDPNWTLQAFVICAG